MFKLEFRTDNAAFDEGGVAAEVAAILARVARRVEAGADEGPVMDSNGNKVGQWWLTDHREE